MKANLESHYIAFSGPKKIARGTVLQLVPKVKAYLENNPKAPILIFDQTTSSPIEIDFRGPLDQVMGRLEELAATGPILSGPGRPKLGVVSREIGLLPRHWEWLSIQPGGASATLRKLVEEAKKSGGARDQMRQSQDATYKFMLAVAGNFTHYEEALRALYAKNGPLFYTLIAAWPKDVRDHLKQLSSNTWPDFAQS